jgi:hypothetical protein
MAQRLPSYISKGSSYFREEIGVKTKLSILTILMVAAVMVGCAKSNEASVNANADQTAATQPAPDNSEVTTSVDATGTKTETRVFRNNPRVSKVVVTTHNGTRTVKAYSPSGEEREIKSNDENILEATGDKVADAAGFVADKSVDAASATKDKAEDIGDKTVDKSKEIGSKTAEGAKTVGEKTAEGAKTVAGKTVEGAKTVGDKTVEGAKVVGDKTAEGAKKAGKAVKKIIP